MNIKLLRILVVLLIALYVAGVAFTMFHLFYQLPGEIASSVNVEGLNIDAKTQQVQDKLAGLGYMLTALTILSMLTFLALGRAGSTGNTLYVEKVISNQQQYKQQSPDLAQRAIWKNHLENLKQVAAQHNADEAPLPSTLLNKCCQELEAVAGGIYLFQASPETQLALQYGYALATNTPHTYLPGEGLPGQVAKDGNERIINGIPAEHLQAVSGLGEANVRHLALLPLKSGQEVKGVLEIATFKPFQTEELDYLRKSAALIAQILPNSSNIAPNHN